MAGKQRPFGPTGRRFAENLRLWRRRRGLTTPQLERAMDRCGRLLVALARLDLDGRLVDVTEQQATLASEVLRAVLGEMGLDPEQQADACGRLARRLRLVSPEPGV